MNIIELKEAIVNGDLDDNFMVFVADSDHFLVNQYVREIASLKKLPINEISSLAETLDISALALVMNFDSKLNILRVDTFNEEYESYMGFKNIIVICDKLDKKIEKHPEASQFIIKMPKLVDWQVKDYSTILCPELTERASEWLYSATGGNIYKVLNELDKVLLFEPKDRMSILSAMANDPNTDLVVPAVKDVFEFYDAIFSRDYEKISKVLLHREKYDFDPFGLTTTLLTKYKLLALMKGTKKLTDAELGAQAKQAKFLAAKYKSLPMQRCQNAISFLSSIDFKVKNGELDLSKSSLTDYIISHLLCC